MRMLNKFMTAQKRREKQHRELEVGKYEAFPIFLAKRSLKITTLS